MILLLFRLIRRFELEDLKKKNKTVGGQAANILKLQSIERSALSQEHNYALKSYTTLLEAARDNNPFL